MQFYSHARYLVELPTRPGAECSVRVIFNPVFSNRCSPFRWLGPARYTGRDLADFPISVVLLHTSPEPPCKVEEIPALAIHAIVLSVRQLL
jgi:hypothetical protein